MVKIRHNEVSKIIRQQIKKHNQELKVFNVGTVLQVGDGIARIYGLEKVMAGELVEFEEGTVGIAGWVIFNLQINTLLNKEYA